MGIRTDDLATLPLKALMSRNPTVDWEAASDVILGCANQAGDFSVRLGPGTTVESLAIQRRWLGRRGRIGVPGSGRIIEFAFELGARVAKLAGAGGDPV